MAASETTSDILKFFVTPLAIVFAVVLFVAFLPTLTLRYHWVPDAGAAKVNEQIKTLGAYGDMFGVLNSLFSGAAFCAIYYTLRIQQKQHDLQAEQVNMEKEKASIRLDEKKSKNVLITKTGDGKPDPEGKQQRFPSSYARIVLENEANMIARNCRVYLTAIEKRGIDGTFAQIPEYQNSLRLRQSTEREGPPEHTGINLEYGNPQYFDVCSVKDERPAGGLITFVQVAHGISKYEELANVLKPGNAYKFAVSVVSENADCLAVEMTVFVADHHNELKILEVGSKVMAGKTIRRRSTNHRDPANRRQEKA
jgi:hypothetical protein